MSSRRIVASFDSPDDARAAVLALERRGVDANDVRIVGPVPVAPEGPEIDADMKIANEHIRHYGIGGAVGAAIFAAVAIAVVLVIGVEPTGLAVVMAALAAIPGFFIGGFWGVGRSLPVSEDAVDTYTAQPSGDDPVLVEVLIDHDVDAGAVEAALRDLHPRDVRLVA